MDHPPSFGVLAIMGIAFIGLYDGFFWSRHRIVICIINDIDARLGLRDATVPELFNAMTNLAAFSMLVTSDLVIWSAVAVMLGPGIVLIRPLAVFMSSLTAIKLASEACLP